MPLDQSVDNIMNLWEKSEMRKKQFRSFLLRQKLRRYKFWCGMTMACGVSYYLSKCIIFFTTLFAAGKGLYL